MLVVQSFLLTLILFNFASADSISEKLQAELRRSGISESELGIIIFDEHGKDLYALNADKLFIPASLSKYLPAIAALRALKPTSKFTTSLFMDGERKEDQLRGSLYLKGGGDPSFTSERLWYLVNEFTREKIKEITGDLVIDDSLFDKLRFDPGRDKVRVERAYDAPIGAASFNWNSVNIFVRPGKTGSAAQVVADPVSSYVELVNQTKTVSSGSSSIEIERREKSTGDQIVVTGKISTGSKELVKYVSISKPDLWIGHHLREFLKQRGILVKGNLRFGKTPSGAVMVGKVDGDSLGRIIMDMMKFSNNYIAEMLTKQLAVEAGKTPATMEAGLKRMEEVLKNYKLMPGEYDFTSPSGFSQKNKIRPRSLAQLIYNAKSDLRIFPELASSLPIASLDGTLKSRMNGTKAAEWTRGKTGLLSGVTGLAGYIGKGENIYTYVFLYNGPKNVDQIWRFFDKMAIRLVE